jgi:hypothetical protein
MILIGFSSYPLQSQKEVAKRLMELPKLPDFIKGKGNYGYISIEGGCEGIQIYEFDDARAEEVSYAIHKG